MHENDIERDDAPLRHDWSLPNIISDQMLASLTEPPLRIHWTEVGDDEL